MRENRSRTLYRHGGLSIKVKKKKTLIIKCGQQTARKGPTGVSG